MLNLRCKVAWHQGTWVYDFETACAQTRICRRCDSQGHRVRHEVYHWESDRFFKSTESGYCQRCRRLQTRSIGYGPPPPV